MSESQLEWAKRRANECREFLRHYNDKATEVQLAMWQDRAEYIEKHGTLVGWHKGWRGVK